MTGWIGLKMDRSVGACHGQQVKGCGCWFDVGEDIREEFGVDDQQSKINEK